MTARIKQPRTLNPHLASARFQCLNLGKSLLQIFFIPKDTNVVLHCFLQPAMNLIRTITVSALEWRKHFALGFFDLLGVNPQRTNTLRMLGRSDTGAPAEYK